MQQARFRAERWVTEGLGRPLSMFLSVPFSLSLSLCVCVSSLGMCVLVRGAARDKTRVGCTWVRPSSSITRTDQPAGISSTTPSHLSISTFAFSHHHPPPPTMASIPRHATPYLGRRGTGIESWGGGGRSTGQDVPTTEKKP
ncbi:hypothetical protein LY78DRAFT_329860 [Colletotrichum sublineola]|nr:hypothetical protein LY78DRAFT_329860 [Colletotrichum sublineola]